MRKLNIRAFGLAFGILWGGGVFISAMAALWFEYGTVFVDLLGALYVGYSASFAGAIVGAIWGFVDGFIGGSLFAWLYNRFVK